MKILLIGSGGREHALAWKIAQSPQTHTLWCAPGNPGTAQETIHTNNQPVQNIPIQPEDIPTLLHFADQNKPNLTIVGPDNPLALGIVDHFQQHNHPIWGPNRKAAQFESSKTYAHQFMTRHNIPTPQAATFHQPQPAIQYAKTLNGRCAIKADGLALGKGVILTQNNQQAQHAIHQILTQKTLGNAGNKILIQEHLTGTEISIHAFCDGKTYKLLPPSQDHKPLHNNNQGPNTGGMGAYTPTPFITQKHIQTIRTQILDPWLTACQTENIDYRGILYPGIMLTKNGPKVLEINTRFGDPETQTYLPKLKTDLIQIIQHTLNQTLTTLNIEWTQQAVACIILASGGYPAQYKTNIPIHGIQQATQMKNTKIFHAGTKKTNNQYHTNGGRVLGITTTADTLPQALTQAYQTAKKIHFHGIHYRTDIGAQATQPTPHQTNQPTNQQPTTNNQTT